MVDEQETKTMVGGTPDETTDVVESNNGVDTSWSSGISEEYLENAEIKKYVDDGDINNLLKSFREKQKVAGSKGAPKADAPQEEWIDFYKSKGLLPEDPSGYGVENEELAKLGHTLGLSKAQLEGLVAKEQELSTARKEAENKQYEENYGKLVEKYGGEAEAQEVLSQADKYAQETFGDYPEFFDFLSSSTIQTPEGEVLLGNHPIMAEALKIMFEKTADDGKKVDGVAAPSAADNEARFAELTSEMSRYAGDKSDPEYAKLQKEFTKVINAMNS